MKTKSASFVLLLCLTACLCAKPNIVLILADDMGPHLSMLKTPGIQTPNIDKLAQQGITFEHAFSASGSCAPSRTAILTGMWPHSNGTWRNVHSPQLDMPDEEFTETGSIQDSVGIHDSVQTLPAILKDNGYYTAITQKFHLSPAWRFPFDGRDPVQSSPNSFRSAINRFAKESGERPFYIAANIAAPHRAYQKHLEDNPQQQLPDPDQIQLPPHMPRIAGVIEDMQRYYACVEIVDACVAAILETLEEQGELDDTLVIFTSDQGPPIHYAKASAYPAATQIPLIISKPQFESGRRSSIPVSQIDLAPTILDLCGIARPSSMQGESILPILKGQKLEGREVVFAEHNSHGPNPREHFPQRVVTDGEWYYILNLNPTKPQLLPKDLIGYPKWGNTAYQAIVDNKDDFPFQAWFLSLFDTARPREQLYNIDLDPWGMQDLASHPATQDVLIHFRALMKDWREKTNDIDKSPLEIASVNKP